MGLKKANQTSFKATHGGAYTAEYGVWSNMLYRCDTPTAPQYPLYGGRGIGVCERWRDFANFIADMGERPHGASLDRIDPNGDYEASNCRWATATEQANNRRNTRRVLYRGREQALSDWCRELGLDYRTAATRFRRGWAPDRLFSPPKWRRA